MIFKVIISYIFPENLTEIHHVIQQVENPAGTYLLKVNNRWRRFGVFIVNFEHISHLCSSDSIVNFEHVTAGWDTFLQF